MKLNVDRERCMGHAVCAMNAPDLMQLDDLGYNVTGIADVPSGHEEKVRRAAGACPEGAIKILETGP